MIRKIQKLNIAYRKIIEAIKIIEDLYGSNREVKDCIYQFKKVHGNLNRATLTLLKQEQLNSDWKLVVLKLK